MIKLTKIISRICGGIGNQLFCYAAARRLAIVNDAELVLDNISGFANDIAYQRHYQLDKFNISCRLATSRERLEPYSRIRFYLLHKFSQHIQYDDRRYIRQEGVDFDPRLLAIKPRTTLYLEGYWQSENYFYDINNIIRSELEIQPPSDSTNQTIKSHICRGKSVAIHVRFFEKLNTTNVEYAQRNYYKRAIDIMESLVDDAHYYIFSDVPEAARNLIPLPDNRLICIKHNYGDQNAYADLWLMTQCQHFIIADSTFSWWGAWLGNHYNKYVIAPKNNISIGKNNTETDWNFPGLIPRGWIVC